MTCKIERLLHEVGDGEMVYECECIVSVILRLSVHCNQLTNNITVKPRLHQDTCCRIQVVSTCIHFVAVNMFLVSATKLSPVCRSSVAGYKS